MFVLTPSLRPSRSTALGSALLAGSAIGLFGWDINKPETLAEVNTKGHTDFVSKLDIYGKEEAVGTLATGDREEPWLG
jgi:glycerol kinase